MSYIGLRKYYADYSDIFADVCAVLAAAGWTLHDTVDASTKVYKSQGEDGTRPCIYLWIQSYANQIRVNIYLYWDAATHTGSCTPYYSTSYYYLSSINGRHIMAAASKDFLILVSEGTGYQYMKIAGHVPKIFHSTPVTNLTAGASSGSSVTLTVASTSGFKVGNRYQIIGVDGEGRDQLTIESITDATHLVVGSLPRNYASGAYLGSKPVSAVCNGGASQVTYLFPVAWEDDAGTVTASSGRFLTSTYVPVSSVALDPDTVADGYGLAPLVLYETGLHGYFDEYLMNGVTGTQWDMIGICSTKPEQGEVSSAGSLTLSDSTRSWATNEWAGKLVVIVDGTGAGQCRSIASNTGSQLTVDVAWDTTPDGTSTYRILDEVYRFTQGTWWLRETVQTI